MIEGSLSRLGRASVVYGVGTVLNRFLGFLLVPLFTRYLSPESYGITAMLSLLGVLLSGVFSLGTGNSLGVCYFAQDRQQDRNAIVRSNVVLLLVNAGLLLAIGTAITPALSELLFRSPRHSHLVLLSLVGLAANTLAMPFLTALRVGNRPRAFVAISLISTLATLALSVVLVVRLERGVQGLLEATAAGSVLLAILGMVVAWPAPSGPVQLRWMRDLVRIGYPSIVGLGALFMIDWVDRALLERMAGLQELGVYSIGYSFGMVMTVVGEGAFGSAWPPFFMSFVNRRDEAIQVFGRVFKYVALGLGTVAVMFFLFARPVVALMTAPAFHSAYSVVGFVAAAYLFKVLYLVLLPPLYFERKLYLQSLLEWSAAILNLGLNLVLIPVLQKDGAAVATLCAYMVLPAITFLVARRYLPVRHEWGPVGHFLLVAVPVCAVSFFRFQPALALDLLLRIVVAACFSGYVVRFILTAEDRQSLFRILRRPRLVVPSTASPVS